MRPEEAFVSLIVPVYNEENRLEKAVPHVFEYFRSIFHRWEILYVDDGSTDSTSQKLLALQQTYPALQVIRNVRNYGKGRAIRNGFSAAQGDFLLFSDADFSTPVEETSRLLEFIFQGYDIAIGSRALPDSNVEVHQSWMREALGKAGNLLVKALLPLQINDTQCGFKIFRKDAARLILPKLTIDGFAFDIEMLTVAALNGLRIAEVPVTWRNVPETKVRPIHSLYVLRDLFSIRFHAALHQYR